MLGEFPDGSPSLNGRGAESSEMAAWGVRQAALMADALTRSLEDNPPPDVDAPAVIDTIAMTVYLRRRARGIPAPYPPYRRALPRHSARAAHRVF